MQRHVEHDQGVCGYGAVAEGELEMIPKVQRCRRHPHKRWIDFRLSHANLHCKFVVDIDA